MGICHGHVRCRFCIRRQLTKPYRALTKNATKHTTTDSYCEEKEEDKEQCDRGEPKDKLPLGEVM